MFLFLDDYARGEGMVPPLKQLRLAVLLQLSRRETVRRLAELGRAGYLQIRRTMTGNFYQFAWAAESQANVPALAQAKCQPGHNVPYRQETTSTPLTPQRGERCNWCRGKGHRPGAIKGTCPGCKGSGEARRSA